jgi:hydroxymethylglutaryl-CoA lyase
MKVRAYVSTVYGCPYEGAVDPGKAVELVRALRDLGCYQISLGDTIGVANPRQVRDVLGRVLAEAPARDIAVHFHDTRGTALANILIAVEMGISTVDSALGGLGGCPYAPGASGNVATEDVVYMLEAMGMRTGVDLAIRAVNAAMRRDAASGEGIDVAMISRDGYKDLDDREIQQRKTAMKLP